MADCPDLHNAVSSCRTEEVRSLLAEGADPNVLDDNGRTALAHVPSMVESGALRELLQVLLDGGANPHRCDKLGNTALFYALDHGRRTDESAVMVACQVLLDAGVSIEQVGVDASLPKDMPYREVRPLHLAMVKQLTRTVRLLLHRGANPLAEPTPTFGWNALHFAAILPEFATQFVRQGLDPFAVALNGDAPVDLMGQGVRHRVQMALLERERDVLQALPMALDEVALRARVRL